MNDSAPVIELEGLAKSWSGGNSGFTLEVEHFAIHPGEFVAAVGPSGSGKSTFLDLLGMVLRPDRTRSFQFRQRSGAVLDLATLPAQGVAALRRSEIGYVLQSGGLLEFLTLRKNIALPALLNRMRDPRRLVDELAAKLGIQDQLCKKPGKVSGGQRQRAAIARALIHRPRLVLADEPSAALDPPRAKELMEQFKDLCANYGIAVVMVTHHRELVAGFADRLLHFTVDPPQPGQNSIARCLPSTSLTENPS